MNETPVQIRTLTNSELQAFKGCRRDWYLGYHLRLTPVVERQVGPLKLGSRVHEALAVHYSGGDAVAAHLQACQRDEKLLAPDITEEELKKFVSECALGGLMIEGYLEWLAETGADHGLTVHAIESKIEAPLASINGQQVNLLGKLDSRVTRELDGARLFLDHKTCASFADVLGTILINEQFPTYQLLERLDKQQRGGDEPLSQGSIVNMLRKVKRSATAKPPFYYREEVHHSDLELDHFQRRLIAEAVDMLRAEADLAAGLDHRVVCYPRPSRDCTWRCKFLKVCGMMEDGSDAQRFLDERYTTYDPLARYANEDQEGE